MLGGLPVERGATWKVRRVYFRLAKFVTAVKPLKLAIPRSSLANSVRFTRKMPEVSINSPKDFVTFSIFKGQIFSVQIHRLSLITEQTAAH